jgi:hypothetical protein
MFFKIQLFRAHCCLLPWNKVLPGNFKKLLFNMKAFEETEKVAMRSFFFIATVLVPWTNN